MHGKYPQDYPESYFYQAGFCSYAYPINNSAGTVGFIVIFSSLLRSIGHAAFESLDLVLIGVTVVAVFYRC